MSRVHRAARTLRVAAAVGCLIGLGACASFSDDGGFGPVRGIASERLSKEVAWARTDAERQELDGRVAELLARPLSADDAVQLALLNNRTLQASFYELGISEAALVQAGRLPNPGFSFGRTTRGSEIELERGVQFNLAGLLTLPMRQRIAARQFQQAQRDAALRVVELAGSARIAYYEALAARETVRYRKQVMEAAEAGAELARRMATTGNWNRLLQAREQGFYADAALNLAQAQQAETASRERLVRLLGLWGDQLDFRLPERLPDLPGEVSDRPGVERFALAQRLDVESARLTTLRTADDLGLTRATRVVNVLELGALYNTSNEEPAKRGFEVAVELPLFDWGQARVARSRAVYMQSLQRAAQIAIDARSEVRQAYAAYRSAYDIARHVRDEIVPIRQRIAEENLLRYNGMLIGVFELLADARAQIASVESYIAALRDFWIAQADLEQAMLGRPALPALAASAAAAD
ncbi:Outer membrane efflux protein [Pigmentiphaga humi]|uniref:Outer membrane efflux protein n=1 Tax=Pigmentiphaga humi TaxID=2478468 RepID=A0A3P4B9R3_9BURK|nr:TolC family protein [Pigmentiphaga humi]VCU72478.1 Outer membrane efflux protein [Pigmentiphaga humi]